MIIRSRFAEREKHVGTINDEKSMTSQEFKQDTDLYYIISRFSEAYADRMNPENFVFSDFDRDEDFQYWQNKIVETKNQFYGLTAKQREFFGQDVARFHAFISDVDNFAQGVELGIFEPNRDDFGNILSAEYQLRPGMKPPVVMEPGIEVKPLEKVEK